MIRVFLVVIVHLVSDCTHLTQCPKLMVRINRERALGLSHHQVVERWGMAHKLPPIVQRWLEGQLTHPMEQEKCIEIIERWRERLWDLSWYMKELNYDIACKAN
ncbi:transposase, partial [Vibrio neptunius]|nr:transposase [Vibrio neptunius]MBN3518339.1 transposase [Vibrio neptunius]MBN3552684.1 transposase [Vibrio neptunius]MBN3580731.1 transposase [Vibrio neptunius]MCH9874397.1 transposase [Vibrio neptunius]